MSTMPRGDTALPAATGSSPLQLLMMFFPLSQTFSFSCFFFLLGFCNEKFGRSHLFSGSFAQALSWGEGGSCSALFTSDSVIILIRALFLIRVLW